MSTPHKNEIGGYGYTNPDHGHAHAYLLPTVTRILHGLPRENGGPLRVFDLGCGNGSVAAHLAEQGFDVTGVDPSVQGIEQARKAYPHLRLEPGSCYDDLVERYGTFSAVVSLEVVEHVYAPRDFARSVYSLLKPGGVAVISTPYHGYLKNLAMAVTGKMESHFTALWDHGHIKFWSFKTLRKLLEEAGLQEVRFARVGRLPILAKSMIAIARKP